MTDQLLDEIHPGEILLEEFMKPMGITARQLAADMDVPPSRISDIVNGARPITADTALRLGLFFSMEPRFWLNLQTDYDMRTVTRQTLDKIAPRIRVFQAFHHADAPEFQRVWQPNGARRYFKFFKYSHNIPQMGDFQNHIHPVHCLHQNRSLREGMNKGTA